MKICIDFDGTCVTHEFPKVGRDIGAVPVLKRLVEAGHQLILFTMRSNRELPGGTGGEKIQDVTGLFLDDAVNWFSANEIPLFGINENPTQKRWTSSPKAYGELYIDDAAFGAPLIFDPQFSARPFVNWKVIETRLEWMGVLPVSLGKPFSEDDIHEYIAKTHEAMEGRYDLTGDDLYNIHYHLTRLQSCPTPR